MSNLLRLAIVIFKGNGLANFAGDANRRKRKLSTVGSILLFSFLAVYLVAAMSIASITFYDLLSPVGLQSMLVSIFLSVGVILVFLFGILYIMSIFYYSSDVEKILPLPLRAEEIIGAKLLVASIYEYLFLIGMVAPALAVFGIRSGAGPAYYITALLVLLLLPTIPLCLAAILIMLVMRFTRFARNKDRFSLASGLIAMGLALAFVFGTQSLTAFSANDLANLINAGGNSIARLTASIFPGTSFAAAALTETSFWRSAGQLGLLALVAAAAVAAVLVLGRLLYFKGVIGLNASASSHRKLTARELDQAGKGRSAFWTYALKDFRVLVRTPIFLMNNVLMNFLWPVFILIPLLSNKEGDSISQVILMMRSSLTATGGQTASLALAIAFGAACFITGANGIAESALSREGKVMYIMKILPMSYTRQLWAKLAVGILISLCGTVLLAIMLIVVIQPPLWFALLVVAMLPGATMLPNVAGIIFELYWPKLNWDNEQKAVKQNLNVVFGILLAILLAALVIVPVTALQLSIVPTALLVCILPLLLTAGLAVLIHRIGPRQIRSMNI